MDQYRRSNVPLNQSQSLFASNVVSTNAANISQYESAQIDLMYYLKWVILIIGIVIAGIFLKAIFGGQNCQKDCQVQPSYARQLKNYFSKLFSSDRSRSKPKPADKSAAWPSEQPSADAAR